MLSKKEFESFRRETEEALKDIAKKYNVSITAGKIKYSELEFTMALNVKKTEIEGKSFEQTEFEKYCSWYQLKPEDYNKSFKSNGNTYNIIGFKPNRPKYPIIAKREDGKQFKFTEDILEKIKKGA